MTFIINQHYNYIDIFENDTLFLQIKQKANFWSKKTLEFCFENELVLVATSQTAFFRKKHLITYQNTQKKIVLFKNEKNILLLDIEGELIELKRDYLKNPIYSIFSNSKSIGFVNTELFRFGGTPAIYEANIDCTIEDAIYFLFLLVIQIPSSLDE